MADELDAWLAGQQRTSGRGARRELPRSAAQRRSAPPEASGQARPAPGVGASPVPAGVISGTARPNPARVPYPPEAYVGVDEDDADPPGRRDRAAGGRRPPPPRRSAYRTPDQDDDGGGPSPMVWLTGIAAIAMLAAIAFLVFQLVSGGGPGRAAVPAQVSVPNFVGQPIATASQTADGLGIHLEQTG